MNRQPLHVDNFTDKAYSGQPFQNEVTVLVGLSGQFSVVCHDVNLIQGGLVGGIAERVSNTHTVYILNPGDVVIFDAHYCAHYGNDLLTSSARLHFTYAPVAKSKPVEAKALIDAQRSFYKYEHASVYPLVQVAAAPKTKKASRE